MLTGLIEALAYFSFSNFLEILDLFVTKLPRKKGLFFFNVGSVILGAFFLFGFVNSNKVFASILLCLCRYINSNILFYKSILSRSCPFAPERIFPSNFTVNGMGHHWRNQPTGKLYDAIYRRSSDKCKAKPSCDDFMRDDCGGLVPDKVHNVNSEQECIRFIKRRRNTTRIISKHFIGLADAIIDHRMRLKFQWYSLIFMRGNLIIFRLLMFNYSIYIGWKPYFTFSILN